MSGIDKLIHKCTNDGVIAEQDEEVIRFGIDNLLNLLSCIVILICVGYGFGSWKSGVLFFLLFFPLRKYAGGYHSDTRLRCIISSVFILVAIFSALYVKRWSVGLYIAISAILSIFIFCMAPVQNQNKLLDDLEKKVYRRRTRVVLLCEDVLFVIAYLCHQESFIIVETMVLVTVGLLMFMGCIKLHMNKCVE